MSRNHEDHRSIFDRPVHDYWDKRFDEDHDGWMTPSERGHRNAFLAGMEDESQSGYNDEDDDDLEEWERDDYDSDDGDDDGDW